MQRAIDAVVNKQMSIRRASLMFKIPESTLESKLPLIPRSSGKGPVLSKEEESGLAHLIIERYRQACPLTRMDICHEAKKVVDASGRPHSFRKEGPTYRWLAKFLRRNPQVREEFIKKTS